MKIYIFVPFLLKMTNKFVIVGIVRINPRFDRKSLHWLDISMEMENPRLS